MPEIPDSAKAWGLDALRCATAAVIVLRFQFFPPPIAQPLCLLPLVAFGSASFLGLLLIVALLQEILMAFSVPHALTAATMALFLGTVWLYYRRQLLADAVRSGPLSVWLLRDPPLARVVLAIAGLLILAAMLLRSSPLLPTTLVLMTYPLMARATMASTEERPVWSWKKVLQNACLMIASILSGLAILEGVSRLAFPAAPAPEGFWMPHPERIFTLRPNSTGQQHNRDRNETIQMSINADGFREPPIPAKTAGDFRILALGDSFTFGFWEHLGDSIPKRLESVLDDAPLTKRMLVINGGAPGYGPYQELDLLQEKGFEVEPDLVVLQVLTGNDVHESVEIIGKYLRSYHVGPEVWRRTYRYQGAWQVRLELWLQRHSTAYFTWMTGMQHPGVVLTLGNELRFLTPSLPPDQQSAPRSVLRNPALEMSLIEWYPELDEAWSRFQAAVLAMRDACAENNVDFLAYCIPTQGSISDEIWEQSLKLVEPKTYERGKGTRLIHAFFEDAGIPYVDILSELDGRPDIAQVFHRYDGHFSVLGNRIVAERLGQHLLEEYFPAKGLLRSEE
ncbi:MAG: hypothetical protein QGD90_01925 [Candidatus Hydrogenedentes bacterium]|nr:hypothetical protein [Candidatus Hydrogenedentota bacterium]